MVAAIFVQPAGIYSRLPVDLWPESRDARTYAGPHPVVAHPPCASWGRYAKLTPGSRAKGPLLGDDGGCFASALTSVRRWGGVLEHPAASKAWAVYGLPAPVPGGGWSRELTGPGYVCEVEQGHYGHPAEKRTWLYLVTESSPPPAGLGAIGRHPAAVGEGSRCARMSVEKPTGSDSRAVRAVADRPLHPRIRMTTLQSDLGTASDLTIARRHHVAEMTVRRLRKAAGIAPFQIRGEPQRTRRRYAVDDRYLGVDWTRPTDELAELLQVSPRVVSKARKVRGIPSAWRSRYPRPLQEPHGKGKGPGTMPGLQDGRPAIRNGTRVMSYVRIIPCLHPPPASGARRKMWISCG